MAVLIMVNPKNSGMAKQKENIDYISNPVKRKSSKVQSFAISGNYEKAVELNRYLHRKDKCKRHFKHFIVSLERERSLDKRMLGMVETQLCKVLRECGLYYMEYGFATLGAVHCNTQHMHFHIQIDTCNCITGEQWGQSKQDLVGLKEFVSQKLLQYGLEEEILCNVQEVAEEEMLLEEDMEYPFGSEDFSGTALDEVTGLVFYQCPETEEMYWNNGTTEQFNQFGNERPDERLDSQHYVQEQEICRIVDKNMEWGKHEIADKPELLAMCWSGSQHCVQGHEMCWIVDKTKEQGKREVADKPELREMCRIVDKTKPRKMREMCKIIDNTKLREMCIIVDKSKPREMCRIVD